MSQAPDKPKPVARATAALRYLRTALGPLLALVIVIALFSIVDSLWYQGTFATQQNARTMAAQSCVVGVAAFGMTLIIVSGGIDLSAGIAVALCATTLAWGMREDVAVLVTYGGNFKHLSQRLAKAQEELRAATAEQDEANQEYWRSAIDSRRKRLLALATGKLPRLQTMLQGAKDAHERLEQELAANPPDDKREAERALLGAKNKVVRLQNDITRMEQRIKNLGDATIDFQQGFSDNETWLKGIPNASASAPLAMAIGLVTGLLAGLVNGTLISTLRVAPFIVTLGTMTIFLGLGTLLSNKVPIRPAEDYQVPLWVPPLISPQESTLWFGFPLGVWLSLLLALAIALILRYTVFGRHVFALGSNESTARLCGINVSATKIAVYALAGLLIGAAGILHFSRQTSGDPTSGTGMELKIIAAVVVGGASLSGGRGTVLGTLAGVAIMAVIDSGCTQLDLDDPPQKIVLGIIIIGAVVVDQLRQRGSR